MIRWWRRRAWRRELADANQFARVESISPPFPITKAEREQIRQEIKDLVDRIAPGGIDEGTGHALDELIEARLDQWRAQVNRTHQSWVTAANHLVALAAADEQRWKRRNDAAFRVLIHSTAGLEYAVTSVLGEQRQTYLDMAGDIAPDGTNNGAS